MIYMIHPNVRHYLSYVLDSKETRKKLGRDSMFHFDPSPKSYADHWQPIEISFAKLSGGKKGEVPDLMVRNGRLFLNEKAYEALRDVLASDGEFLPVSFNDQTGYLFNILSIADEVNGLDQVISTKDEFDELQSLAFHEDKVNGFTVFRTAFDNYMDVYCCEAFKDAVERADLKGLLFSTDLGNVFPPDPSTEQPETH